MSDKIQQLKKELEEAEKLQKRERSIKEMEELKVAYEGKCFGSHTFERKSAALYMRANMYEKFYMKEDKIYVLERSISISRYDSLYKPSKSDISYSRSYYERCLSDDNYNASYMLYNGYHFYRKEISVEKFKQLWTGVEDCSLIIKELFETKTPELRMELIREGDSNDEDRIEKKIKAIGLDIIDFKLYTLVHRQIEYATLPMFQDRRWMPRIYAKSILEYYITELRKEQQDSWTSLRMYDTLEYKIGVIREFINTNL